jgi:hypothetical protein
MTNLQLLYEDWRYVPHYEGIYIVSNRGRIRSFVRKSYVILKPVANGSGYYQVTLLSKRFLVHRLVAIAFLERIEAKDVVNHLDSNPGNNYWWNLEWATCLENQIYSGAFGNGYKKKGSNNYQAKINELTARAIVCLYKEFKPKQISRILGIPVKYIYRVVGGKTWAHATALPDRSYYYRKVKALRH